MPRKYTPRVECVCARCGVGFTLPPCYANREGLRYCSRACYHAGPRPGKKHRVTECQHCHKQMSVYASRTGRYCSHACHSAALVQGPFFRACEYCTRQFEVGFRNSPRRFCSKACTGRASRKMVEVACASCGRRFFRKPSQIAGRTTQYCCVPCKNLGLCKESAALDRKARNTGIYKAWRLAVLHRDKRTCQKCGRVGGRLHAHHIKPFVSHHALRYVVSNGITFCKACHEAHHAS